MHAVRSHRHGGLTLVEVLAVLAVLVLLAGMLIPAGSRPARKSRRIACVNNLKHIGLGMRIFAANHAGEFPMNLPSGRGGALELSGEAGRLWQQFLVLTNELVTPSILACPRDVQRTQAHRFTTHPVSGREPVFTGNHNLSYFLNINAREEFPESILAGDRNLTNETGMLSPGRHLLANHTKLGFNQEIHDSSGNILLGDGSVQQVTTSRLREQFHASLTHSGLATNVWIVP